MTKRMSERRASVLHGERHPVHFNPLHRIFEQAVRDEQATCTGLYIQDKFMPYCEVNRRANIVARSLKRYISSVRAPSLCGRVENEAVVAVDVEPGPELIVALLGILKIGATYMPVDSQSAINRLRYVLNEAEPSCIIVDGKSMFMKDKATVWSRYKVVDVDQLMSPEDVATTSTTGTTSASTGQGDLDADEMINRHPRLISIIYTSGSTGKPKGVCTSHQSVLNRLTWQWEEFPFGAHERGCFKTSLLFVDSVIEIFGCVLKLISLVICPRDKVGNPDCFMNMCEVQKVTRLTMVPSMLRNILFYLKISGGCSRLPLLKLWICNSETLTLTLLQTFFETFPEGKVFANLYGSTETMADVTFEVFYYKEDMDLKQCGNNLSIGRPMYNNTVYVVDEGMCLIDTGQVGEICVSGLNVAEGYLDGDLQQQVFVPNPFSDEEFHGILYKTGDFGRIYEGVLIYEGRRDLQVKIRGQRVNISEIEKAIQECPWVEKTVVLCHKFSEISSVIVAYYTTHNSRRHQRAESAMMENCRKCLPQYMMPKLLHVQEIPLQTHTGKIDRAALKKMYEKAFNRQSSQELEILDEKGRKALNIIALNLNLPTNAVSRKCSFFELGGNSVSMIATIVQLKEHSLHIPIGVFSGARTIQDIIDRLIVSKKPIGETLQTNKYVVRPLLNVKDNDQIIDVLTDSFIEKEPLVVLLGVTKDEFLPFARSLYREACKSDMSVIVIDKLTGKIVGGDFLFDYFKGVSVEHHETMSPILSLLNQFEEPIKEQLKKDCPGELIFNFCLCVHKDLPHADQVMICHLIEGNVLQIAKERGYAGVITNNTNPATQDICQHFFDYDLVSTYLVKDFDFNNHRVFSHAPDDYYIKMMLKRV